MWRIFALALCGLLWCGCAERDETRHPLFRKGRKARSEGDGATAAECFRTLLVRRPGAVRSHLELAGIYDELLNEPLLAAAHYRIYLELVPDAPDREIIRVWQQAAEKRFRDIRSEPGAPPAAMNIVPEGATAAAPPEQSAEISPASADPSPASSSEVASAPSSNPVPAASAEQGEGAGELAELRAENERLRAYLDDCKKQLALLGAENRRLRAASASAPKSASPPPETYTVAAGDTLSGIAQKVYGSSRFYPEILRANPGVGERSLRPGKVLRIPPRPDAVPEAEAKTKEVKP